MLLNWKSLKLAYEVKGSYFPKQTHVFYMTLSAVGLMSFENTVGKGEIACNKEFQTINYLLLNFSL